MRTWSRGNGRRGHPKVSATVLMFLLWLGTFALASSHHLHGLLHEDAQNAAHNCFVTQVQQQTVLAGSALVVVPALPLTFIGLLPSAISLVSADYNYRLSPSRAPPTGILTTIVVG